MKIAFISVVRNTIPPLHNTIDGIASISATLAAGLQQKGHQLDFVRSKDSLIALESNTEKTKSSLPSMISFFGVDLLSKIQKVTNTEFLEVFNGEAHLLLLDMIRENRYDIVHFNTSPIIYSLPFTKKISTPKVFTLHDQFTEVHQRVFDLYSDIPNNYFVSISDYQRKPINKLNYVKTIYHGIDTHTLSYSDNPEGGIISCGRIHQQRASIWL